jgi:peptidoglycan/LPS O-acetylase OafA/YrhL
MLIVRRIHFLVFKIIFCQKCLGQTWYLNVDMQLALLAPLVLIPLMKWPRYALGAIGLLTLASMAACFGVTYVENLPWAHTIKP